MMIYKTMENIYKALKYVIIWIAIYFIIKYTSDDDLTKLDIALISTVLTLIICILESMIQMNMNLNNYENMEVLNQEEHRNYETPNNLVLSGNMLSEILSPSNTVSHVVNQSNIKIEEIPVENEHIKSQINTNVKTEQNYMGETAIFNVNEFGGTIAQKPQDNDNKFNQQEKPLIEKTELIQPNGLKWYEQKIEPRKYAHAENLDQIAVSGGKTRENILTNEMVYSDFNRMPPSFNKNDFEYGYSYLPPADWFPIPAYPPVCVSNQVSNPQPVYLDSTTMDLKDWHETQKITPPDTINTAFITNELNSKV